MKISSLSSVSKAIKRKALVSFAIFLAIFLIFLNLLYSQFIKDMNQQNINEISGNFDLLKSHISEKISIVSNTSIFIDYLRSGSLSRKALKSEFVYELKNLRAKEISGLRLATKNNKTIYFEGVKSRYYVELPLCYFDRGLDSQLGACSHNLTLYLDAEKIINTLKTINESIVLCHDCPAINFLENKKFGSFLDIGNSSMPLKIMISNDNMLNTILVDFFIILVMVILSISTLNKTQRILEKYISDPLRKITYTLKNGDKLIKSGEIEELSYLIDQIEDREKRLSLAKFNEKAGQLASQVAHDIRSPLAALNAIVKQTLHIPEQQRVMMRNAAQQINDIANNLLSQYTKQNLKQSLYQTQSENQKLKSEEISVLLDCIVSEKRAQFSQDNRTINLHVSQDGHGIFSKINSANFKRVISNLINNAIEATNQNTEITIHLSKMNNKSLSIVVQDNGVGIPPSIIEKIMKGEPISSKKHGTGIGLESSIKFIKDWGGTLTVDSKVGYGTTIKIKLPLLAPEPWFAEKLSFVESSTVVILDDDQSIHDVWQSRIENEVPDAQLSLIHLFKPSDLLELKISQLKSPWYLCDYELIDHKETGLELIEKLGLNTSSTLVTSRSDDPLIREKCLNLGIKILPKNYAPYAPINIIRTKNLFKPDAVLIEDNESVISAWMLYAAANNKQLSVFRNLSLANQNINNFDRSTRIYIDSDLGDITRGEEYAKALYDMGFKTIYLTTGYDPSVFRSSYWIKSIVNKDPKF